MELCKDFLACVSTGVIRVFRLSSGALVARIGLGGIFQYSTAPPNNNKRNRKTQTNHSNTQALKVSQRLPCLDESMGRFMKLRGRGAILHWPVLKGSV